jgi:ribosomal-protein-serine acetyltransferase
LRIEVNEHTLIKDIEEEDAGEIFVEMDRDREYLRTFLGWVDFNQSLEDTKEFIEMGKRMEKLNSGGNYLIRYKGKFAGVVSLNQINWTNHYTSIGYWLASSAQGKGIMTQCVRELIRYAFDDLGLNRAEIRCATTNHRSEAIPIRLGFKWEGRIREAEWLYDHYVDHQVYGLLKRDWELI